MKQPSFYNNRGRLTAYGLSCGYVERVETVDGDSSLTLWSTYGQVFHVREHSRSNGRRFWYSYATLTEARNRFDVAKHVLRKVYGLAYGYPRAVQK